MKSLYRKVGYNIDDVVESVRFLLDRVSGSDIVRIKTESIIAGRDDPARAIFEWIRENIVYTPDPDNVWLLDAIKQLKDMGITVANPENIEFITSPERIIYEVADGSWSGEDCDGMALLMVAMCRSVGIEARFVILNVGGDTWDHAVAEVMTPNGWVMADPSSSYPFGWAETYKERLTV